MQPDPTTSPIGDWRYNWGGVPRPFVHPVRTPSGRVLSVDAPEDHPWHHALWFTIKFVNDENFWEEFDEFGLLVQSEAPVSTERPDGSLEAVSSLSWRRPGPDGPGTGEPVIDQQVTMTYRQLGHTTVMDWDITLTPITDVTLDRTPFTTWGGYGGLTFRGRGDWHDTELMLDTGAAHQRALGERSRWCSLQGPLPAGTDPEVSAGGVAHEEPAGLAVFDHPDNPNHPVPWYASTRADTYGSKGWSNFMNAALLWDGPIQLAGGETLRTRHRVCTFDGNRSATRIESDWHEWVEPGDRR